MRCRKAYWRVQPCHPPPPTPTSEPCRSGVGAGAGSGESTGHPPLGKPKEFRLYLSAAVSRPGVWQGHSVPGGRGTAPSTLPSPRLDLVPASVPAPVPTADEPVTFSAFISHNCSSQIKSTPGGESENQCLVESSPWKTNWFSWKVL